MCDPVTGGLMAINAASSISSISEQNGSAAANAANATQAANNEYASTTAQYIEQNRSLIQGGFDAILEGRAAESAAYASAIENGVQGASIKAVMRSQRQNTRRGAGRTRQELQSLRTQTGANYDHIASKQQGRINSVPTTSFGIGDLAKIATPAVESQME